MDKRKLGWSAINLLVILYALIPLLWILSLSLKPTSTVKDGKLFPSQITFDNYKGIFTGNVFSSALVNSIGIGLITTVIAVVIGAVLAEVYARLKQENPRVEAMSSTLRTLSSSRRVRATSATRPSRCRATRCESA